MVVARGERGPALKPVKGRGVRVRPVPASKARRTATYVAGEAATSSRSPRSWRGTYSFALAHSGRDVRAGAIERPRAARCPRCCERAA